MKPHNDHFRAAPAVHCGECGGGCSSGERWILHNVRHKAIYRRLCTHCVLNCFRGHFCPVCLEVFDPIDSQPRPNQRVMCLNCPSISHLSCASSNSGGHPFQCPSCSNPNFSFFTLRILPDSSNKNTKAEKNADANGGCNLRGNGICRRVIDKDSAKVLVAAARIAAVTMNKAAHTARIEAERRVKEAALARKRAREALERVSFLSLKEKEELKMVVNGGLGTVQEKKMKPRVSNSAQENKQIQSHIPR
ncbi:hypothetical protein SAY87_000717 [Trapa incisa]|uniref:Uncharacterized protein n=1 Tax=Trapa incisa TaxID=236973 RepID=A0AAN7JA06_9MYRT|nr:hypothetical protein SAY87_000717 [Trapa incisa]